MRGIGSYVEGGTRIMLLVLLGLAAAVCLTYQILAISHRYPLDYGEAPLVDQAMRLAAGQNIYRADISTPPYGISNYPPLYVLSLIPFLKLFGPSFVAGRLISVLCALASGGFLAGIIYSLTRDRLAAAITGLLFLAFPFVVSWSSLLRVDLLGLALSLAGLALLAGWPITRRRLMAAAILLAAAIYTRQSYALAAPLAAFIWLWANDRGAAIRLAALVGGLSLIAFLLLNILTQGGFYFNVVTANINEFGVERLKWNLGRVRDAAPVLLVAGGVSLLLVRRWNRSWPLVAPYLIGAGFSALTAGKIGSNVNYFLELCAALSLAAGTVVAWSRGRVNGHALRAGILLMLALQTGHLMDTTLERYAVKLKQRRSVVYELGKLESTVAEASGPILADEYMGMITLQERPLTIQPFEVTQLAHAGLWDQAPLVERIRGKEFPLILIHYFPESPVYKERWTPEMLSEIQRAYVPTDSLADTTIYRPIRSRTPIEACPGAPWRLPSSGDLGVRWREGGLDFYGLGNEGAVPVIAMADGRLTRLPDWIDTLAVQHDDPVRPGQMVWTYYGSMRAANGLDSTIVQSFPPGASGIPVKAGQLLGYQGSWSGRAMWPAWMHVHFSVVQAAETGTFPEALRPEDFLDPSPYLGLAIKPQAQERYSQPLRCEE